MLGGKLRINSSIFFCLLFLLFLYSLDLLLQPITSQYYFFLFIFGIQQLLLSFGVQQLLVSISLLSIQLKCECP